MYRKILRRFFHRCQRRHFCIRSSKHEIAGGEEETNTIILDAYNANPSSMQAAIENLFLMKAPRKVLILGDMFELEQEAGKEHTAIGKLLREKEFKEVYLCGALFKSSVG